MSTNYLGPNVHGIASPAAAVPEGALPPLPEPKVFVKRSEWHDALMKRQSFNGWRVNYGDCDMNLYTVEQVRDAQRAAVEADRARQQDMSVRLAGAPADELQVLQSAADALRNAIPIVKGDQSSMTHSRAYVALCELLEARRALGWIASSHQNEQARCARIALAATKIFPKEAAASGRSLLHVLNEMSGIVREGSRWNGDEQEYADKTESDISMLDSLIGEAISKVCERDEIDPAAVLTEPEIIAAWNETEKGGMVGRYIRFARAIESEVERRCRVQGGDGAPDAVDVSADRAQQGEPVDDIDADPDDNADFCKWREESGVDLGDKWVAWAAWCGAMNFRATKSAAPADAPTVENVLSVEAERRKFEGWARADLNMPDDMPFIWTSDWSKASWEAWMAAKVCAWLDAPSAAPVPDTGIPTAGEVEKAGNRFFNFNVLPTLTKEQEAAAKKGYCPVCNALELYEVNVAYGMRFCQCNHCKDIVVLAGPSEAKAGEDA